MPTHDEIQRIAAAMHALRPEWNPRSLATFLERHHATRAYRDLATAACIVATDPRTKTPQLLNEHGPWWAAAQTVFAGQTDTLHFDRCTVDGHKSYRADNCGACRADTLAANEPRPAPEPVDVGPGPELARTALNAALTHQEKP